MNTSVKIKKLSENAILPKYGTEFAAGADLYALCDSPISIAPGESKLIHTGIAMAIPEGLVGLIFARSGLATKQGLAPANKVGVIDSDYRGEIMVCFIINKKGKKNDFIPNQDGLLAKLAEIKGMTSVSVSINTEKTNVIMVGLPQRI